MSCNAGVCPPVENGPPPDTNDTPSKKHCKRMQSDINMTVGEILIRLRQLAPRTVKRTSNLKTMRSLFIKPSQRKLL